MAGLHPIMKAGSAALGSLRSTARSIPRGPARDIPRLHDAIKAIEPVLEALGQVVHDGGQGRWDMLCAQHGSHELKSALTMWKLNFDDCAGTGALL